MAQSINCNFSRTAIRTLCQREFSRCGAVKELSQVSIDKVVQEYNELFLEQEPRMNLSSANVYKKIPSLLTGFNKKWYPHSQKSLFLDVFALNAWTCLSEQEKNKHTLEQCSECQTEYPSLAKAFPAKNSPKRRLPVIEFNEVDLSSSSNLGKKALRELDNICEENFNKSVQEVIAETPRSKLVKKSSWQDVQSETRKTVRSVKNKIQQSMDDSSLSTVMANRLSWRKFDKMRKSETLESNACPNSTPTRKRKNSLSDENTPSKRKHGSPSILSKTVEEDLLREAQTWSDDKIVNWSDLAREHGITKANGGQTIKEFLNRHNIPAASSKQRPERGHRRKRKTLPGGIPFPMHRPSSFHKNELAKQVETGEIVEGVPVVPVSISGFRHDKSTNKVVATTATVCARKIPLSSIRKSLLAEHEKLGLIRHTSGGGLCPDDTESTSLRFLKIWHDHSSVAGHGHLLVLVSVIYDAAFYLTQEEANSQFSKEIDIQSTVEAPAIHILGRSSSSVEDQAVFSETRNECLRMVDAPLTMSSGMKVRDVVRFFHGDGPAQQFEAGNSIGGNYCCVGCGVKSDRIDDIAYAYRCKKLDLQQRQEFLLQGNAWKKIGTRPLDKLLLSDLKAELSLRGVPVVGRKKPILEKEFEEMRTGISNFPALLQDQPEAPLESLNLQHYEVSPTEPLHDLKGHLSNIIDETLQTTNGQVLLEVNKIKAAVLTKEAVRCSDIRKAAILIYLMLRELQPDSMLTDLYGTAVEITRLCYAHDDFRTPRSILRLYNCTFLHAYQCSTLFCNPKSKSTTRRRMFGRYFHSISVHAAALFRIISLRSLNTEQHERMFQQAKALTKGTSNNHPENVISNIIKRLQFEHTGDAISSQESQIKAFSATVGPMKNTVIPKSMLDTQLYQAHLEQLGDFLIHGPGVWWKETPEGIMFFDGTGEQDYRDEGPILQSFRSVSSADIELYLQEHWEACCSSGIVLPATCVRYYQQDGTLESISVAEKSSDASNEELPLVCREKSGLDSEDMQSIVHTAAVAPASPCSGMDSADVFNLPTPASPSLICGSSRCLDSGNMQSHAPAAGDNICTDVGLHCTTPSRTSYYKTTLAKNLYAILRDSPELQEFDKLRYSLKNSQWGSTLRYTALNQLFEQRILQQHDITSLRKHTRKLCKKLLMHEWGHQLL